MASLLWACGEPSAEAPPEVDHELASRQTAPLDVSAPGPTESCARDLAERTPAPVRATLGDLGYDMLFADACVAQRAERSGDASICTELSVSTLRERCIARVAIVHERPSDCPSARTIAGRDPLCVALAARDRRLCVVAGLVDEAVCSAVLGREGACARLPDTERDTCVTRAAELAPRVEGEPRTTPRLETSLEITPSGGEPRTLRSADRGARIEARGCTQVLTIGDPARLTAPFGPAAIAIEIVLSDSVPFDATFSALPTEHSSALILTLDGSRSVHANGGSATITRLDAELGGVVEGSFHATFPGAPAFVDGTFHTFVRDRDPRPAACGE